LLQAPRESEIPKLVSHKKCSSYTGNAKPIAVELCAAQCGAACDENAALGKLFRPAVAQNPSMSTPVVGQPIFWRGDARTWPLARGSAAEPLGQRHCWERLVLLSVRAIALGLQVTATGPFANANAGLQAIFICRAEMNATVQPAHCRFLGCIEAGWKAAVHAG
jgi:hypothetical protein